MNDRIERLVDWALAPGTPRSTSRLLLLGVPLVWLLIMAVYAVLSWPWLLGPIISTWLVWTLWPVHDKDGQCEHGHPIAGCPDHEEPWAPKDRQ